jgi:hypothetical protein
MRVFCACTAVLHQPKHSKRMPYQPESMTFRT